MLDTVELVLPNGKRIIQKNKPIREFANNDYSANSSGYVGDKWWENEPKTAYSMMSASPMQTKVNSEKW